MFDGFSKGLFGLIPCAAQLIERRRLNRVAVDEKELVLIFEKMPDAAQRAAGTEDFFFAREVKGAIEIRREVLLDEIGEVVKVHHDLVDTRAQKRLDRVCDQRFVAHGHERFWKRVRDRPEPRAESGGEDHRPHS